MIILKRLNVVRKVATEEQAAKLERQGFIRTGGSAEGATPTEERGKTSKASKKEGQNGGTDQPDSGDGAK